ncbi:MAG TPA: HPF/RaiA family ribosome-associated protein [Devosia sp.]|nr:HPF/RaiA family ribosome-associated protein [Devosia sp.]
MDAPVEISFRHFEPTERIRELIENHVAAIDNYENSITSGRVIVDGKNHHGSKTVVDISVELKYRGGLALGRRSGEFPSPAGQRTFDMAVAQAFEVAENQIKEHFRKRRDGKDSGETELQPGHGRIARLNASVRNGFIEMPNGVSLFFSDAVLTEISMHWSRAPR